MSKRIDKKKHKGKAFTNKVKKVFAIFFCILLLIFSISIIDMSTRKMIMCNDDKYAIAASFQEDNKLRLDVAGEKLMINIEPVIRISDYVVSGSKRYYNSVVETIKDIYVLQ